MEEHIAFFQQLNTHFETTLPFVVYRKPNSTSVNALLQENDDLIQSDAISRQGFVFCSFSGKQKVLIPTDASQQLRINFQIDQITPKAVNTEIEIDDHVRTSHIRLVQDGISKISQKELVKVVLSRKQTVNIGSNDPFALFQNLLNTYTNAFCYLWYHPKVGMWLGASPETFVKYQEGELTTMSLAGTKPIIEGKDIEWGDKEKYEQQLVTDYIMNQLKSVCDANVAIKTDGVHTIKAGSVGHLRTMISLQLSDKNLLNRIINLLHPTPAVAGLPTQKALKFIAENEGYRRNFYTGYLGEIEKDSLVFFVNLRCMQLQNEEAIVYIGGGITADSIPEKEWEETVHKSRTMLNILTR